MSLVLEAALSGGNDPIICYNNISSDATLTASTEDTDFDVENVQNNLTWNFWRPTAQPSDIEFDLGSSQAVSYCGIAAHNCGTQGNTITLAYSDNGSSWTDVDNTTPSDDSVIVFLITERSHRYWRLTFSSGSVPTVGVVYFGTQLVVERRIYSGHSPLTLSKKTVIRPQKSEGGQWLGRSKIRQGAQTTISISNLGASWFRTNFEPFINDAIDYPFFFAWRPTTYTDEVGYCWTTGDIVPVNNGQAGLMNVSFTVDAILE
jgi:hypothetical protein